MNKPNHSSLATTQHYFELSNAGNLTAITSLLHPEATYSSANTGLYYGVKDIMIMMKDFFKAHQKLKWQIESIEALNDFIVEVHFSFDGIDANGQKLKRTGIERLVVVDGLIKHIEVR